MVDRFMNSDNNKNYFLYPFFLTLIIVSTLILFGAVPFDGAGLKNIDILSDLRVKDNKIIPYDEIFEQDSVAEVSDTLRADSVSGRPKRVKVVYDTVSSTGEKIIPFEDYSIEGDYFGRLADKVSQPLTTSFRIAFLGDSFIEGDLLTMDVRETMQRTLGGNGVGFVPVCSAVANFRATVSHTFDGWETVYMKNGNSGMSQRIQTIVGSVSKPKSDNAWVEYKITGHKSHLKGVKQAYFYFIANSGANITVKVNETLSRTYNISASENIQRIAVDESMEISKVRFTVEGRPSEFYAYGVSLDNDKGVVLDSFGDRGSSGGHFARLDSLTNIDFASYINYDLIVVEFGLNVLEKYVMKYTHFENRMVDAVNRLKMIYPDAAIVVMGIGDRVYNDNGNYVSMPSAVVMRRHQRNVAKRCAVAYWDTFAAMGGAGSMLDFVKKGYAAKDYIHLSWRGAAIVADKFTESLLSRLKTSEIVENSDTVEDIKIEEPVNTVVKDSIKADSVPDIYSILDSILSDTVVVDTIDFDTLETEVSFND